MGKFSLTSTMILSCLFCILLNGCAETQKTNDDTQGNLNATNCMQYMPQKLILEEQELLDLEVQSLTTSNHVSADANTQKIVKDFFNQLTPTAVPITKDEYENSWFISGYICIEFQTTDGSYVITGDVPSEILVCFKNGGDNQICYGKYSVTEDVFDSFVSHIYGHLETKNVI